MPRTKNRFAGTVEVCCHHVKFRYWDFTTNVTSEVEEALEEEAYSRARSCINDGCHSGELNCRYVRPDGIEEAIRGWWQIDAKEPPTMSDKQGTNALEAVPQRWDQQPERARQRARAKFPYLAGELERLTKLGTAGAILELMEATWLNHGDIGEPYSDIVACEIAINELIDYAREHGCRVTFDNTEIGSPYGVVVHPPDQEQP